MALSERDCAELLDMSQVGLRNAEKYGGSIQLGYTIAALEKGIEPYGVKKKFQINLNRFLRRIARKKASRL